MKSSRPRLPLPRLDREGATTEPKDLTVMDIYFSKISTGYRRPGKGYNKGIVLAVADGYRVHLKERAGWSCSCRDPECEHPEAVAALIAPDVLEAIECL